MWDIQGEVPLAEGVDPAAVRDRIVRDLGMMAHTRVWPGEDRIAFRVSRKRWWWGGLPMVDMVDAGQIRIDGGARALSFRLATPRMWFGALFMGLFFFGATLLLLRWSPIASVAAGIGFAAYGWLGNQWRVEKRVTRYLTQLAAGTEPRTPTGLPVNIHIPLD